MFEHEAANKIYTQPKSYAHCPNVCVISQFLTMTTGAEILGRCAVSFTAHLPELSAPFVHSQMEYCPNS